MLTESGVRAAFGNHAEFTRLTLDRLVNTAVRDEVTGVNRAWIPIITVGALLRTVTRYRVTFLNGALTAISALLNGEAAGLTVTQVKRTNVVGFTVHVLVAAVIRSVEGAIGIVACVRRAGVEVIASVLLYAALVDVALHRGASVTIVVANDVRVDTAINVHIALLSRACVSIVTIYRRMLTASFIVAEIGCTRHTVVTHDGDGLTATLHEACIVGTRVTVVAVNTWVEAVATIWVAVVFGAIVFVVAVLLLVSTCACIWVTEVLGTCISIATINGVEFAITGFRFGVAVVDGALVAVLAILRCMHAAFSGALVKGTAVSVVTVTVYKGAACCRVARVLAAGIAIITELGPVAATFCWVACVDGTLVTVVIALERRIGATLEGEGVTLHRRTCVVRAGVVVRARIQVEASSCFLVARVVGADESIIAVLLFIGE